MDKGHERRSFRFGQVSIGIGFLYWPRKITFAIFNKGGLEVDK